MSEIGKTIKSFLDSVNLEWSQAIIAGCIMLGLSFFLIFYSASESSYRVSKFFLAVFFAISGFILIMWGINHDPH